MLTDNLNFVNALAKRMAEMAGEAGLMASAKSRGPEELLVGSNKGDPKPPDPLITTVACKHVWGGLIPPLQQECAFGCKFLPAVKSEKTLISSPGPPPAPQLGMIDLPEVTQSTSSLLLRSWSIWNILRSEGNTS